MLLDRIFAEKGYHSGGALAFGPDDKSYITVGDATEHPFAQDPSIPIGKFFELIGMALSLQTIRSQVRQYTQ